MKINYNNFYVIGPRYENLLFYIGFEKIDVLFDFYCALPCFINPLVNRIYRTQKYNENVN